MNDRELLDVLLVHAKYSFSNISWKFESLTSEEKDLVKSQEVLDRIRQLGAARQGDDYIKARLREKSFPWESEEGEA